MDKANKENKKDRGSVLQRLLLTRAELGKANLKKTGENRHLKYKYFELEDFLPKLVELTYKNGLATAVSMDEKYAMLHLVNVDDVGDDWIIKIPVAEAKVQGGSAIQGLGSQITYLRRYLLMMAFEISETSVMEQETGAKENALKLSPDELEKIKNADTLGNLNTLCKEMIVEKGAKYKRVITVEYNNRKKQLGEADDNS